MNNRDVESIKKRNLVFLVGFMGTGKTHWGKLWAEKIHYVFVDLDDVIEAAEHSSVHDIFENKGEDYFRRKEAEALRQMLQKENTIISCGGGTPCFFDNMEWMNAHGTTVLLNSGAGYIMENIKKQSGQRPLLKGMNDEEMLTFIESKLKERNPFYTKASITLDAQTASVNSIDQIISLKK